MEAITKTRFSEFFSSSSARHVCIPTSLFTCFVPTVVEERRTEILQAVPVHEMVEVKDNACAAWQEVTWCYTRGRIPDDG